MKLLRNPRHPIDCAAVRSRAEAFVLEELPERTSELIAHHLVGCEGCRQEISSARELFALLPQGLHRLSPPPEVLLDVLERVRSVRSRTRSWWMGLGLAASAVGAAWLVLMVRAPDASSLARALESPEVAVINLFVALDSPLSARYEYRTAAPVRFDRSVGRILYDVSSGEWRLVVHGLPRPPRGARYVLSALLGRNEAELGTIERWEDGVAVLKGRGDLDLTQAERISVELVSTHSRLRLLDSLRGTW